MPEGSLRTSTASAYYLEHMALKQGLRALYCVPITLLQTSTNTDAHTAENQVKQIDLPFGTPGKSMLIFRVKPEVTLRVSMPGNAAVSLCRFCLWAKASHTVMAKQGQPRQSRRSHLQFAVFPFRDWVGLEDGCRKLGLFCTIPVCEMYSASVLHKRMDDGRSCFNT